MSKIIIIEDSNLMRLRVTNLLNQRGFNKVESYNSAEYLLDKMYYYLKDVSLMIIDIELPGITGIEFAKRVNSYPEYANIPIIFFSSYNSEEIVKEAIDAGGIDYILKPFKEEFFLKKVEDILGEPIEEEINEFNISREQLEEIITTEKDRATRGKYAVSFLSIHIENHALESVVEMINTVLRNIDVVYIHESKLITVLPTTHEEGANIVMKKIQDRLKEDDIELKSKKKFTCEKDCEKDTEDMIKYLLEEIK